VGEAPDLREQGCPDRTACDGGCDLHKTEKDATPTEWIVYCETHRHYLRFVGGTGTTWRDDQAEAKRYPTKPAARADAEKATWLDHRPIVWAVEGRTTSPGVTRG
jgi:hypothetical protein